MYILQIVRAGGLEPPRLAAPDPKSGLATNYNTPAVRCNGSAKIVFFFQEHIKNAQAGNLYAECLAPAHYHFRISGLPAVLVSVNLPEQFADSHLELLVAALNGFLGLVAH